MLSCIMGWIVRGWGWHQLVSYWGRQESLGAVFHGFSLVSISLVKDSLCFIIVQMGKKGVLLDNGKVAQSSMALYWKAGQKKGKRPEADKPVHEQKEEDIQSRAGTGMQKWKQHKQKMISKLYVKPQKKDAVAVAQQEQEKQKKQQQQMQRELIEKQLNKNKPIRIPGFKDNKELQRKRQYEQVTVGNQDNNKLILPSGYDSLTNDDIIQLLREKRAKKEFDRAQRERAEKGNKIFDLQSDFMMGGPMKKKVNQPEKVEEKVEQKVEEQNFFKSQILQKIERGESIVKKKQPVVDKQQAELDQPKTQAVPKFIPRSLWGK